MVYSTRYLCRLLVCCLVLQATTLADTSKKLLITTEELKPVDNLREKTLGMQLGPICEIRKGKAGDFPWRVEELNSQNAGEGVIRSFSCLFTISNYWPYGFFTSHTFCELPGKMLRVRAAGTPKDKHHFMAPVFWGFVNRYRLVDGRLYIAWKVKPPQTAVAGGRFSYVRSSSGAWEVWCNKDKAGAVVWTVEAAQKGKRTRKEHRMEVKDSDWMTAQVILGARGLTLQVNQTDMATLDRDADDQPFCIEFGSAQDEPGGPDVVTEYREVFVNTVPYPHSGMAITEGPEDVRTQDKAVVGYVHKTTPQEPRASEGDIIELKDGALLAVYSLYYDGKGYDESPARIVGRISKDGGRTWGTPWPITDRDAGSAGNVMSVSLLRAKNGELLMVYFDKTPDMKAKGMVLRRSTDEGKTWSKRTAVTDVDSPNIHIANNACLIRLTSGRIVLAMREYVGGVRWPYARYSDDDGLTWKSGRHVPEADLTAEQRQNQNLNEPCICQVPDGRLLMTMRTIAGGQFFAWSSDQGETWTKPVLSPLRGTCGPAVIHRIPGRSDILAIWAYGFGGRTPLVSAISSDGGQTWRHLRLLEQSLYHSYGYVSCRFVGDRVFLSYMHAPDFSSVFRFEAEPGYIDQRFLNLPLDWFYRSSR